MRVAIVLAFAAAVLQPAPTEIRLIVKGDDMGAAHGINVAAIDVREVIQSRGIELTSDRDLAKK